MKNTRILKPSAIATAVATLFLLTACASGGGGGGPTTPGTGPGGGGSSSSGGRSSSTAVPFATPVNIGTVSPLIGSNNTQYSMVQTYTQDLTGSGAQNVILAGAQSSGAGVNSSNYLNSQLNVFGWVNGQLVNQTSQWFSGTDNVISGTNNIQFGNFNGNGRQSMYVGAFTDGNTANTQAEIFVNNGSSFTRYNIALPYSINSSGSTTFSYNGVDNIVALDYGPNTTFFFGSTTNNFRAVSVNNLNNAGSAIASGDFLGNSTTTFVITDDNNSSGPTNPYSTRLYNWSLDPVTGAVSMNMIGILPMPILETSQFDAMFANYPKPNGMALRSNNIGIINFDFNESGVPSLVILSMPSNLNAPVKSAVQFLQNNGTGTFTDVTGSVLTGYNYYMPAT